MPQRLPPPQSLSMNASFPSLLASARLNPADGDDGIPPEERKHVLQAIDEGLAAARRGEHVDAEEFVNELLAKP